MLADEFVEGLSLLRINHLHSGDLPHHTLVRRVRQTTHIRFIYDKMEQDDRLGRIECGKTSSLPVVIANPGRTSCTVFVGKSLPNFHRRPCTCIVVEHCLTAQPMSVPAEVVIEITKTRPVWHVGVCSRYLVVVQSPCRHDSTWVGTGQRCFAADPPRTTGT